MLDSSNEAVRERVRLVAEGWMCGKNRTEAYRDAGFSHPSPANAATFFRDHRDEIMGYVFAAVKDKVPVALDVLAEIMVSGKSETARVKAAVEILDRAGVTQVQKIEITNKEASEMENKEIQEEIHRLLDKAGRLKVVGGTDVKG